MPDKSTTPCQGCRDNYYNGTGAKECWMLKNANLVRKFRIGWWTQPTVPRAFREVETYQCHNAPGEYSHYDKLPDFAVEPVMLNHEPAKATQ